MSDRRRSRPRRGFVMTEEPRATLLPCPMCGFTGRLRFEEPRWRVYFVECQDANCLTRGPQHINEPDAIAAWNRRATPAVRDDGLVEPTTAEALEWQRLANLDYPPTPVTLEYRKAIQGEGEHAYTWTDKPHRLVFNLCSIIEQAAALSLRPAETRVKELTDDEIMEVIRECAPWQTEPKLNDLLTHEKSPPMFPQATYDVPSYRATKLVRAIEKRIKASISEPAKPLAGCLGPLCQRTDGITCADDECDIESGVYTARAERARAEEGKAVPVAWQHRERLLKPHVSPWSQWQDGAASQQMKARASAGFLEVEERPLFLSQTGAWRDPDTAPKDKTSVLVYAESRDATRRIVGEAYFHSEEEGGWWWANTDYGDYHAESLIANGLTVLRWMPLPTPPSRPSNEAGE